MARRIAYLVAALFIAGFGLLAGPPSAWAHATLEATSPVQGSIVPHAPTQVTATFDQAVGVSPSSLEVFSPSGGRVDQGGTVHGSSPDQIVIALKSGLGNGTYTVGWHVISTDSHPVQGAWTFSIGAPSSTTVNLATLNQGGSPLIGTAFGVVRFVAFCCFALLFGAVAFVLWCWPTGASSPLVLRLTMGAWSGLAGSVLGAVLIQGVYGAGTGVNKVFWPNVLHATLYSRYGRSLGIRLLLVIVALFVFTSILANLRVEGRRVPVRTSVTWGVLTAALAMTWAAADHSGVGIQVPLALVSDTIHLSSVALWLGGLTMLVAVVLRRSGKPAGRKERMATPESVQAVERFSPIALGCVGAILLTGTYQAWRNVGTWGALFDTTYGRLLLIKIGAMCVLIALGYVARIRIAALRAPAEQAPVSLAEFVTAGMPRVSVGAVGARLSQSMPGLIGRPPHSVGNGLSYGPSDHLSNGAAHDLLNGSSNGANGAKSANGSSNGSSNGAPPDAGRATVTLSRLRWSVAAEASIAAVVLAVTSVLVNTATARETFTEPRSATVSFNTGGPGGRGDVSVTVTPAALGPNQIKVSVTGRGGKPYRPQQIQVAVDMPARHLGPLAVPVKAAGPGRYLSQAVTMTITGQWQVQITIRSDAFDETTVLVPIPVS